ncbi:MAG: (2Fe-2S)-binding protein [Halobacteriaceae archaeon]
MTDLTLTINGEDHNIDVDPSRSLAKVLRYDLGLTGTQQACSTGVCGACTVLIDGEARKSCMHMVGMVEDADIETIEGLAERDELHPVQEAFVEEFSLQCGFCTPGFVMSAKALLDDNPQPNEDEIQEAIHGNICRCTGYKSIIEGIKTASDKITDQEVSGD